MTVRTIHRLFLVGCQAAILTACGDDGGGGGDASNSQSAGDTTGIIGGPDGDTSNSGNTGSASESPTSGMSAGMTEATLEPTEASAATSDATSDPTNDPTNDTTNDPTNDPSDATTDSTTGTPPDETTGGVSATDPEPECGNGVLEQGEVCDDGNTVDDEECSADCSEIPTPESCGDGIVQAPEACDDGNQVDGDGCQANCTPTPVCGNGVQEPGEECDDGNDQNGGGGDTCKNDCTAYKCQAPAMYEDCDGTPGNLTNDPFKALGINCGADPTKHIIANSTMMNSVNNNAWRIATQFGTANQNPGDNRYGGKLWAANLTPWKNPNMEDVPNNTSTAFVILSTGLVAAANQGVVIENGDQANNGDNGNQDAGGLPAPLSAQYGSNNGGGGTPFMNCDGVNDCSDSLYNHWIVNGWNNPDDKLWMQMELTVPPGTEGYVFDFAYFSSEYPTWYGTQYNDLFIAWSTSESYTGNVSFVNDRPLTITSLEDAGAFQYKGNAAQFAGTGFANHAATGWYTARGSTVAEETFQLTFFLADMGDSVLATGVLLDNFRWECVGCIPSEIDSCGIAPQ